jgi:hypothetical protein
LVLALGLPTVLVDALFALAALRALMSVP